MEEEKFSPIGGSKEKHGPKIKVITLLLILILIIVAIIVGRNYSLNRQKESAKSAVVDVLEKIRLGDEVTLEKYLNYNELLNDTETAEEEQAEKQDSEDVDVAKNTNTTDEEDLNNNQNEVTTDNENTNETNVENVIEEETSDQTDIETEEDNEMLKKLLLNFNYEVLGVSVNNNTATVDVSMSTKDAGQIFQNYFTRAIKLTINQTLSSSKYNGDSIEKELENYFDEQLNSSEIGTVITNVKFNLKKVNGNWEITDKDKNLTDAIFPNLMNTISNLEDSYGEYGD